MEKTSWIRKGDDDSSNPDRPNPTTDAAFAPATTRTLTATTTSVITGNSISSSIITKTHHLRTQVTKEFDIRNNHHEIIRRIEEVIVDSDEAERRLESHFVQSCVEALTPSPGQGNSNNVGVSQVKYASFVILYCRNADDTSNNTTGSNTEMILLQQERGMQCTDTLFFFPDLPRILQLEFVRYTSCYSENVATTSTEDNDDADNNNIKTIDDCLDDYNDKGTLFYMEDTALVPELCTFTYPLMISTDLLSTSLTNTSKAPHPTVPPTTQSIPPTITPTATVVITPTPTTTPTMIINDTKDNDGLSTVGILGITITILFMIMFLYHIVTWKCKKYKNISSTKKQQLQQDNNLREDGSVVASEHSHELGLTPISTIDDDDATSVGNRPTLDRNFNRVARTASASPSPRRSWVLLRPATATPPALTSNASGQSSTTRPRTSSRSKSPHHHLPFSFAGKNVATTAHGNSSGSSNTNSKFTYPKPLTIVTENLSENNPVHTRKRFQNSKKRDAKNGHFSFDDTTQNRLTTESTTVLERNEASTQQLLSSTDRTSRNNNHTQPAFVKSSKNGNAPVLSAASFKHTFPYRSMTSPPPPTEKQQSGKENTKNNKLTSSHATPEISQAKKPLQPKITAITFGDVIHTQLQPSETTTADRPMRIPIRGMSSTILRPQQQQQQQQQP